MIRVVGKSGSHDLVGREIYRQGPVALVLIRAENNRYFGPIVGAVAFLVYANSLLNGFTMDDSSVILGNPVLKDTVSGLFRSIDTTSDTQLLPYYRPLTYLSFFLEYRIHEFSPLPMHLVNLLLHAMNAYLVYRIAYSLDADNSTALLAGLLFAVHPLNAESVNFLSGGRNTMLACMFILLSCLVHEKSISRRSFKAALAGGALFLCGMLSKESAVAVLPFIVWLEYEGRSDGGKPSGFHAAVRLLPYAAAGCIYFFMRWKVLSGLGIQTSLIPGLGSEKIRSIYIIPDLAERLMNNLYIIPKYAMSILWPVAMSPKYEVPEDLNLIALPLAAGWIFVAAVIFRLIAKRDQSDLWSLAWFAAFWLPVSGLIWFASTPLADRYLYLPGIGLWIIIASRLRKYLAMPASGRYAVIASVLVISLLSILTIRRNMDWRNDIALFSKMVEQYPDNPFGHAYLGSSYFSQRKHDPSYAALAEQEFEKALGVQSSSRLVYALTAHTQMGHLLQEKGDLNGALYHYNEALSIYPSDREALINRAKTLEGLGRLSEAVSDYRLFLSIPGFNNMPGSIEYAEGRLNALLR